MRNPDRTALIARLEYERKYWEGDWETRMGRRSMATLFADVLAALREPEAPSVPLVALEAQRDQLRAALVALVGADEKEELEQMELVLRLAPAPAEDKAAAINGIRALLATLPLAAHRPDRQE